MSDHYDWIVVGSGFGGSVSSLRLVEKGYKVLCLEKGRRFAATDFPRTNWNLRRWMWMPAVGLRGFFQMTFLRHVTVLHGVGVGGGSLVYANTLPTPSDDFFEHGSWAGLRDWKAELEPHYAEARRMLGSTECPTVWTGDEVLKEIAADMGRAEHWERTQVAVYFGEPDVEVPDPYFGGDGPPRTGCNHCGGCMTGCRFGAKNTLDKNYLYLAEKRGLELLAETEVTAVRHRAEGGFELETKWSLGRLRKRRRRFTADRVVLAGGVMGTMPLLLRMQSDPAGLPGLSPRLGDLVRTNSESLIGVMSPAKDTDFSKGVSINSILHTDAHSHVEPVHYAAGSGFFRLMTLPHAPGETVVARLVGAVWSLLRQPLRWLRAGFTSDWAKKTQVLLYMRTLEGTLRMRLGRGLRTGLRRSLVTHMEDGVGAPKAFMPEATDIANRFADKVGGVSLNLATETLLGVPSTAHILGGACIAATAADGVIGPDHEVHGCEGLYVIDGSAMSANPGVNPSLTITAMAERAMAQVPPKASPR